MISFVKFLTSLIGSFTWKKFEKTTGENWKTKINNKKKSINQATKARSASSGIEHLTQKEVYNHIYSLYERQWKKRGLFIPTTNTESPRVLQALFPFCLFWSFCALLFSEEWSSCDEALLLFYSISKGILGNPKNKIKTRMQGNRKYKSREGQEKR